MTAALPKPASVPSKPETPPTSVAGLIQQANSAPEPAKPETAPKPAAGGITLQIGAYKSQAEAAAAWNDYKRRHAALLAGYSDDIQQADLGEKGTWYRLRVGGFSDREVAVALCDRLKADGGACILGR
jgi:cell division septation protein DedD